MIDLGEKKVHLLLPETEANLQRRIARRARIFGESPKDYKGMINNVVPACAATFAMHPKWMENYKGKKINCPTCMEQEEYLWVLGLLDE